MNKIILFFVLIVNIVFAGEYQKLNKLYPGQIIKADELNQNFDNLSLRTEYNNQDINTLYESVDENDKKLKEYKDYVTKNTNDLIQKLEMFDSKYKIFVNYIDEKFENLEAKYDDLKKSIILIKENSTNNEEYSEEPNIEKIKKVYGEEEIIFSDLLGKWKCYSFDRPDTTVQYIEFNDAITNRMSISHSDNYKWLETKYGFIVDNILYLENYSGYDNIRKKDRYIIQKMDKNKFGLISLDPQNAILGIEKECEYISPLDN